MKTAVVALAVLVSLLGLQGTFAQGFYGSVGNAGYSSSYGNWKQGHHGYGAQKKYTGYGKNGGYDDETIILPALPMQIPTGFGIGAAGVDANLGGAGLGDVFTSPLGLFVLTFLGLVLLNYNSSN